MLLLVLKYLYSVGRELRFFSFDSSSVENEYLLGNLTPINFVSPDWPFQFSYFFIVVL